MANNKQCLIYTDNQTGSMRAAKCRSNAEGTSRAYDMHACLTKHTDVCALPYILIPIK